MEIVGYSTTSSGIKWTEFSSILPSDGPEAWRLFITSGDISPFNTLNARGSWFYGEQLKGNSLLSKEPVIRSTSWVLMGLDYWEVLKIPCPNAKAENPILSCQVAHAVVVAASNM